MYPCRPVLAILVLLSQKTVQVQAGQDNAIDIDFEASALLQHGSKAQRRTSGKKDRCIIHYHIPKTAGTSIKSWFGSHHLRTCAYHGPRIDNHSMTPECLKADYYSGHWGTGFREFLIKQGMTRNCYEFTVLRNPMERAASNLFYSFPNETVQSYIDMARRALTSDELDDERAVTLDDLRRRAWPSLVVNHMCRQLTGLTSTFDLFSPHFYDHWRSTCDPRRAAETLASLDFVGFTEDLDHVLQYLASIDWPRTGDGTGSPQSAGGAYHDNPSQNPGVRSLPRELQDLLMKANNVDIELNDMARRKARDTVRPQG